MLAGVILFKVPFSNPQTDGERVVNLIPLMGSFTDSGVLRLGEILGNVLVFVPLGIYLSMLKDDWPVANQILTIIGTTVTFEVAQFVFAIGRSDVTDVLSNTLGGAIGLGTYALLANLLKHRTNRVINVAALILTLCAVLLFAFLSTRTRTLYR